MNPEGFDPWRTEEGLGLDLEPEGYRFLAIGKRGETGVYGDRILIPQA